MTKNEFFATLMNNQVMPLGTIEVMHEGRGMYSLYVRQHNAPNCSLSRHCDGSKTGQDMHGKYMEWMHEYAVKFDELVEAAHAEALAINATLNIIANDQPEAAVVVTDRAGVAIPVPAAEMAKTVEICHSLALEENARFDNLLARFQQFWHWLPGTRTCVLTGAHLEALEMGAERGRRGVQVIGEASLYIGGELHQWHQGYGRGFRLPETLNCRCVFQYPAETLTINLSLLYGESLRDYWQYASEQAQRDHIEAAHARALALNTRYDFYNLPLVLRVVAVFAAHELALRMERQYAFARLSHVERISEIAWAHFEALAMDHHRDTLREAIDLHIAALPGFLRTAFSLK